MSKADILQKVEKILSDILSRKYDAKVRIIFKDKENDDDKSRVIEEK